jgi:hypothetical protein
MDAKNVPPHVAKTYVDEVLAIYARIEAMRDSTLISKTGFRAVTFDITALDHIAQQLSDYGADTPEIVREVFTHMVENGAQPTLAAYASDVWDTEHDGVADYLSNNFSHYQIDELQDGDTQ